MTWPISRSILSTLVVCLSVISCGISATAAEAPPADSAEEPTTVDFTRDVRPLLSQHCFACHGPDAGSREAGLRLDRADAACAELDSGTFAVVPGKPEASELIARITTDDADLRMPPATSGHTLSTEEIEVLRRWIAAGAKYDDHWSFRAVTRPEPPQVKNEAWVRNPIDNFIAARLEKAKLATSPEADATTLLRRLSLDLTGLPPTPAEVAEFLADDKPGAYERAVDRLLASPHFGERWGRHWLDLAHYADSDGYLGDALRPYAWRYRDWVIDAVNRDLPFDEFTIQQLAGDLLPNATLEQKTATGFLRNTLRNTEAGVDLEEYRLKEIVDRVSTVGIGWLGLSVGCAECHSHKFDPISHREFYEMFAFFNDADDTDLLALLPGEKERYEKKLAEWTTDDKRLTSALDAAYKSAGDAKPTVDRQAWLAALGAETKKRTKEQTALLEAAAKHPHAELRTALADYAKHFAKKPAAPSSKVVTVAKRKNTRVSYVHLRGDYRSKGEDVRPGTPAALPPLKPRGAVADRLDLARWLVDPTNPLTARVTVNHIWQHLFGRGIVATVDNFGSGGEAPSHPELLDWLASEMVARKWSRKEMIRLIVSSAAYRQSSAMRPELEARDPLNTLVARQSRYRVEAESVRDAALAASGLLHREIGGPGIRPPQPDYVASISRNAAWEVSTGADLYRRGMYIVFRRATPYPMLLAFDAPDSTQACARRERSNSPLQALTLLNDPVFLECSQALGKRLAEGSSRTVEERLTEGFQRTLGRDPQTVELDRLRSFYLGEVARYLNDPEAAKSLATAPAHIAKPPATTSKSLPSKDDAATTAAWIATARVLMNLDEFMTRE
jgi:mono/diheme cytochrome c family protein